MEREVAEILLGIKAVTLRTDPPYTWSSGMLAPIYTDNRLLLSYPAERDTIVRCLAKAVEGGGMKADVIAGVATSGIPWAALLAARMEKPMIYVRAKEKGYGKEKLIEGVLKKGQRAVVIEDLISTGGSSVSVVNAVREAGGIADFCLAIFTYELKKASEAFSKAKCKFAALTNLSTLVQVASEMGYVTKDERDRILEWSKDPEGWGEKRLSP